MRLHRRSRSRLLGIGLLLLATAALAQSNQTPTHRHAAVFAPLPAGQSFDESFLEIVRAEGYSTAVHVWGRGEEDDGLTGLLEIAASDWGVLYIHTHGSRNGLTIEDFGEQTPANRQAARAALAGYRTDTAIPQAVRADLSLDVVEDPGPGQLRVGIGLDHNGLRALFGNAGRNRRVVILTGCNGAALQGRVQGSPTFAATEVLVFNGLASNRQVGAAMAYLRNLGGYHEGFPKRPIPEAIQGSTLTHLGSGDTTLAAAITEQVPAPDAVLPLGDANAGSTTFDTKMATTQAEIVSATGCNATVANQAWASDTSHTFDVSPTAPGQLILTVDPDRAVDAGNGNRLVGNKWKLDGDGERTLAEDCPFGLSGLDGGEEVPTPNPYRWCVWCGAVPEDSGITDDEQSMMFGPTERPFAAGERHAFVVYQDAPGPGTRFAVTGAPPTLTLEQTGEWHARVTFTPDAQDVGQRYDLVFTTEDERGPRATREITYVVVEPSEPWVPPTDALEGAPPTVQGDTTRSVRVGATLRLEVTGVDPDDDPLTWTVQRAPVDVEIERDSGAATVLWQPSAEDVGEHVIALALTDGSFAAEHEVTVHVEPDDYEAGGPGLAGWVGIGLAIVIVGLLALFWRNRAVEG